MLQEIFNKTVRLASVAAGATISLYNTGNTNALTLDDLDDHQAFNAVEITNTDSVDVLAKFNGSDNNNTPVPAGNTVRIYPENPGEINLQKYNDIIFENLDGSTASTNKKILVRVAKVTEASA